MSLGRRVAIGGAALLCVGFVALGGWQVQRLQWKTALIEQVEQRVHAAPVAPPPWQAASRQAHEYRRVQTSGHFLDQSPTLVQASTVHGSGYWVLHPFLGDDGRLLLVNRGFVPPELAKHAAKQIAAPPASSVTIGGLLRMSEPGGGFLRKNDPVARRWYSRDVAAIAAARGLGPVAPYFIDQDAQAGARADAPVGGLTVISFNNHHLVYALTWFVLALMAAAAAIFVARERPRTPAG